MLKPFAVVFAVAALAAGCVTVNAPSPSPASSSTLGVTTPVPTSPTPSLAPSAAPTVTPTAAASLTAAPSVSPEATQSAGPTAQPSGDLGFDQRDVIWFDDLTDPASGWGTGTTAGGSISYANGSLQFATADTGAWMWSRRLANVTSTTMRVIGDFYPTGEGRFGVLCSSGDAQLYGAVVGTDGSWAFISLGQTDAQGNALPAQELLSDASAGLKVAPNASNLLGLECAGSATGEMRLTLWLNKSGPIATYTQADGPANWDRGAAYVEASNSGFSVAMDNVILFGSRISDGSLSPEGQQLLAHVPTDWQSSCYQGLRPPYLATTADAVLTCFLPAHDGAEIAEYAAYSTAQSMTDAYQSRVDAFGTGDNADHCNVGSGEHGYNISGTESGRLLCVNQFSGIRFDWTDTRLNILSTLVDFDGSFSSTFADWDIAGPNL